MDETTTRRAALQTSLSAVALGAAALGMACARPAAAQPKPVASEARRPRALRARPPKKELVPLPFDPEEVPGLSAKLLTAHHRKNNGGAVDKLNLVREKLASADPERAGGYWSEYGSLKSAEAAARNSALLHELYFANLGGGGTAPPDALGAALAARFGSLAAAEQLLRGSAKSVNGWVILGLDRSARTVEVVQTDGHSGGAWEAEPLLVLDVFEHAYAIDYGPDKGAYLDAFFRNLEWREVGRRFEAALARL